MFSQLRMVVASITLCALPLALGFSQSASASPITYEFTGTYSTLQSGADTLGLVGASFSYTSTYDRAPSSCGPTGSGLTCIYLSGTSSLTLAGTAGGTYDGTYSPTFNDQVVVEEIGATFFGSAAFTIAGKTMQPINVFLFNPALFSGPDYLLPVLSTADFTPDTGGGRVNDTEGVYKIDNFTATSTVPEPATLALLAMGLVGMGFRRRRQV